MHPVAVYLFALNLICVVWPEESLRVIEGLGVRVGKCGGVVTVPNGDTNCASRGRPFVCVKLNLRRLDRREYACD